jgi:hypothetical protein
VFSFHFFEKLFLGVLPVFLCSFCTRGKKTTFNFERCPSERNVVSRKEGGEEGHEGQREGQELNYRICSHLLDLEITTQTFMLHTRPSPLCPWASLKHSPHWSCDESKKAIYFGDLASFLVCARKFKGLHALLFAYVCMWHAPIRTWSTIDLRPSLRT